MNGTKLSQVALSIHLGVQSLWLRRQGNVVSHRGETWEAFYRCGRLRWYERIESVMPRAGAEAMK